MSNHANPTRKWRERAVRRSTEGARTRAADKSDRLMSAALDVLRDVGPEFTVQDVVDRSKTSLRSFYQFFDGKDDLVLALYEETVTAGLQGQMEAVERAGADPVCRLRAFMLQEWELLGATEPPLSRALALYHFRLAESRTAELLAALDNSIQALSDLVAACRAAGRLRTSLDDTTCASILLQTLNTFLQAQVLGVVHGERPVTGAELWSVLSTGILAEADKTDPDVA
jgi:AcrR family transcriptional regulator